MAWSALIDLGTKSILTISQNISVIVFLRESTLDTAYSLNIDSPNYTKSFFHAEPFFLARGKSEDLPNWAWSKKTRTISPLRPELVTDDLRARSRLAVARGKAVAFIFNNLNVARIPFRSGLDFQEHVYETKRNQAQRFKDSGYDESMLLDIAYVLHYADLKGISLQQAADDILFRAKLDDDLLAKTEHLRLKFLQKIKNTSSPGEIPGIMEAFFRESNKHTL